MNTPIDTKTPEQSSEPTMEAMSCCAGRRTLLKATAAAALGALQPDALAAGAQDLRPARGDRLVTADGAGTAVPLKVTDIVAGRKPIQAFPLEVASGTRRDGSRFNKVLLVRFDPATLDADTRARSADGVLAYSAVCTHEGCDVTEYVADEKALMCFCHFSKFAPCEAGKVVAGPAPRNLPYLPLRSNNGELEVAGVFSAAPGAKKLR